MRRTFRRRRAFPLLPPCGPLICDACNELILGGPEACDDFGLYCEACAYERADAMAEREMREFRAGDRLDGAEVTFDVTIGDDDAELTELARRDWLRHEYPAVLERIETRNVRGGRYTFGD